MLEKKLLQVYGRSFSTSHVNLTSTSNSSIFFGLNVLNRYSFLRSDAKFINRALRMPQTRLIFLNEGQPVCVESPNGSLCLATPQISRLSPKFQQRFELWGKANETHKHKEGKYASIVFMGMKQEPDIEWGYKKGSELYSGVPYFAIDVTSLWQLKQELHVTLATHKKIVNLDTLVTSNFADHLRLLSNEDASLFSQASMYLNWLQTHRFCSGCGHPMTIINAGTQLVCTNNSCFVSQNQHTNASFPRTDVAIISAVLSSDKKKILLVQNKRIPTHYTCVAGFLEPSESIEKCVEREIWEETNVLVDSVRLVVTQPWPYPSTLMIGCCGIASNSNNSISLDHDPELSDAQWFDVDFVKDIVEGRVADTLSLAHRGTVAFELIRRVVGGV